MSQESTLSKKDLLDHLSCLLADIDEEVENLSEGGSTVSRVVDLIDELVELKDLLLDLQEEEFHLAEDLIENSAIEDQ